MKILVYLKNRKNSKNEHPIYLRITVDGKRKECSLNRSILANKWDKHKQCGKGRAEEIMNLNKYLSSTKETFYRLEQSMIYNGNDITVETIMNKFLGKDKITRNLIEIINDENKRIKLLISDGTYRKYIAFTNHIKDFLKFQYNISDISISKIDYQFILDFEFYLRSQKNIGNNTSIRYVKTLQKYLIIMLGKGWIKSDPCINYKSKKDKVDIEYLNQMELNTIHQKDFQIDRLNQIRDIFVFASYTGLSYSDLAKLSDKHIVIGIDSKKWIKIHRTKNGNLCSIPLLPEALEILDKYKDNPLCLNKNILLPVISNERYNGYLKEIAAICKISKNLTTHTARHTCGTMLADRQISIETIAKVLGHSDIKTTQIYAKITDFRIASEMKSLTSNVIKINDEDKLAVS